MKMKMDINPVMLMVQVLVSVAGSEECEQQQEEQMRIKYSECLGNAYSQYKDRLSQISVENVSSRLNATCQYFSSSADGCGQILSSCYDQETIRDNKDHLIKTRLIQDGGEVGQTCSVVTLFNKRQSVIERTGHTDEFDCSSSSLESLYQGLGHCSDESARTVHHSMENLTNPQAVSSLVCQALTNISTLCTQGLNKCFSAQDIAKMASQEIKRFKPFLLEMTEGRADTESLQKCPIINDDVSDAAGAQVLTATDQQEHSVEHIGKLENQNQDTVTRQVIDQTVPQNPGDLINQNVSKLNEAADQSINRGNVLKVPEAGQDIATNAATQHTPENVELVENTPHTDTFNGGPIDNAVDNEKLIWTNPHGNGNLSRVTRLTILVAFTAHFLF